MLVLSMQRSYGVMLNFWKVGVAPTTPLYTKTPPLIELEDLQNFTNVSLKRRRTDIMQVAINDQTIVQFGCSVCKSTFSMVTGKKN